MIAVDSSSWIAFFAGEPGADVEAVDRALELKQVVVPPVVLTEILGVPDLDPRVSPFFTALPVLEIEPGFWERAAASRAKVLAQGRRARLADTLISQACIDHRVPLITRDSDFRHFARFAGLVLA